MPEIHPYHENDLAAASEAISQAALNPRWADAMLREIAGAIAEARAQGRRQALLDAAEEWDANTNHACDAPALLRELADFCEDCLHLLSEHSSEPGVGCLRDDCPCLQPGTSEADQ